MSGYRLRLMTKSRESLTSSQLSEVLISEQSSELLKELHLLTNQGQLNADARRKLKQVNHLYQLIAPAIKDIAERFENFQILDVGAGRAYLGFILYEIALKYLGRGEIISVEAREDLVVTGQSMAKKLGFTRMKFINSAIEVAPLPERIHLLTALHACDTATDDAIISGLNHKADYIVVVPCCQAESARLLKDQKEGYISELWRRPLHRREFGSHLTNVLRTLVLESLGYDVTVTELVGWEHSLKNELIFAKKAQRENRQARQKLAELMEQINVQPKIIKFLIDHEAK
jgi:hypothetical protein